MRAWVFLVLGILIVLMGAVWTLQGLDVLGGSAMSGNALWAVLGPVAVLVGVVLVVMGARARRGTGAPPTT